MQLYLLGLSFRTADMALRERVAFGRTTLTEAIRTLVDMPSIQGAIILSTCNRMEIYVDAADITAAHESILQFLSSYKNIDPASLEGHLYVRQKTEVVHHLFSVISSLDSMVLGEQQIAGQVRTAFSEALQAGGATMMLAHLFRQALAVSKRVRNQTAISENHVSVSTVAIDLARETLDSFEGKTTLVVGSGEMSELAARYLQSQGVESFIVSSRTYAHACSLARELGGSARYFDELESLIKMADIVLSSTAAPHYVIGPEILKNRDKPLFMLDIALPRDIDPACKNVPGVILYDLDDINERIKNNRGLRQRAADEARRIVDEETDLFIQWTGEHAVTPTIKRMRADAEAVRAAEVDHLLRVLHIEADSPAREAIDAATCALVNKILHTPTVRLKQGAGGADLECIEAVRYLFGYSEDMMGCTQATDTGMADSVSPDVPDAPGVTTVYPQLKNVTQTTFVPTVLAQ